MSFLKVLRRTIGQNILEELYNTLLEVDILKCDGQ